MKICLRVLAPLAAAFFLAFGAAAAQESRSVCLDRDADRAVRLAACSNGLEQAEGRESADLLVARAQLHRAEGSHADAAEDLQRAVAAAHDNAEAWTELGRLRRTQGDLAGAFAAYTTALAFDPEHRFALLNRADLLGDWEVFPLCLADAEKAVTVAPDHTHSWAYRGRCRLGTGDLDGAVADLDAAIELGLDAAFVYVNLALARQRKGEQETALAAAEEALARDPANELGRVTQITALVALDRTDEAFSSFRQAQALDTPDPKLANDFAWELYLKGHYELAKPILVPLLADREGLAAEHAYEADTQAHIHAALGEHEAAVEHFLLAAELGGPKRAAQYRAVLAERGFPVGEDGRSTLADSLSRCLVALGSQCRFE